MTTSIEKVENVQENQDSSKGNINPEGDEQIAKGNEDDCPMSSRNRNHECSDDVNTHVSSTVIYDFFLKMEIDIRTYNLC